MADQPAARVLRDLPCSARSSTPRPLRLSATPRRALGTAHHNTLPLHGSRRRRLAVSASATEETSGGPERFYFNFTGFPFPLGPFLNRRTTRTEAVKGSIWLFEQEQALGFSSVSTNIRTTVVKLKSGGIWVHAPIAPTKECTPPFCEMGNMQLKKRTFGGTLNSFVSSSPVVQSNMMFPSAK